MGLGDRGQITLKPRAWGEAVGLMLSPCKISLLGGSHPLPSCSVTEREPKAVVLRDPWGGLGMSFEVMAALGPGCPQAGGHDPHPTTAVPCPSPAETTEGVRGVPQRTSGNLAFLEEDSPHPPAGSRCPCPLLAGATLIPLSPQRHPGTLTTPEHTVELRGATLTWAGRDKSSKKNVLEVSR